MMLQKAELAQKIHRIKGIVPRKTEIPVLRGVLAKDGQLIANNLEMAVKVKLRGTEGESFVIPEKAFGMIDNLPDGEVEILASQGAITIKIGTIKNTYQTLDAAEFPDAAIQEDGNELKIDAETLLGSMKRVSYAVPAQNYNAMMTSLCLRAAGGWLNFVGLDGHVMAWDKVGHDGEFELLIPKGTVEKLKSIGLSGEVRITHNKTSAVFVAEEVEVHTRLVEGRYFDYEKLFTCPPLHTAASRADMLDAMTRVGTCAKEQCPVKIEMEGRSLSLSVNDGMTDYRETLTLREEMEEPLTIGFNSRLILETLKAFDCENVGMFFGGPKMPMVVEAEDSDFKALVLPVVLR